MILIGLKSFVYFALLCIVVLTLHFSFPNLFCCYSKTPMIVLSTEIGIVVSQLFAQKLSWFLCGYGDEFSVLYLPFSFPSSQINLLNSLLNITSIWYINISPWSSLYQIFSKAISHPFRSQLSLCTSISFITTILRIFCISYLRGFFFCIYQIPLFS